MKPARRDQKRRVVAERASLRILDRHLAQSAHDHEDRETADEVGEQNGWPASWMDSAGAVEQAGADGFSPSAMSWIWRFFNDLRSVGGTGTSSVPRGFAAVTSLMEISFSVSLRLRVVRCARCFMPCVLLHACMCLFYCFFAIRPLGGNVPDCSGKGGQSVGLFVPGNVWFAYRVVCQKSDSAQLLCDSNARLDTLRMCVWRVFQASWCSKE